MEYEEYTKRYCDNCVNKDCTRIPINNDGSLIEKESPNICRYFKKVTDNEIFIETLREVQTIIGTWHSGSIENQDIFEALDKAISIISYIGENDLIKRDDVYNFLEYSCNSLKDAIDGLYEIDKVDFDYLNRIDVEQ